MKISKNISFIILVLLLFCTMLGENVSAQETGCRWSKWSEGQSNQGTGNMMDKVIDSYIDSAGNTYIFGQFGKDARWGENGPYICPMDSITGYINENTNGVYLAKIDSLGNILWCKSARGATANDPSIPWNMVVKSSITIAFDIKGSAWLYFWDTLFSSPNEHYYKGKKTTYFVTFDFDGNIVDVHDIRLFALSSPSSGYLFPCWLGGVEGNSRFEIDDDNNIHIFSCSELAVDDSLHKAYIIVDNDTNRKYFLNTNILNGMYFSSSVYYRMDSNWQLLCSPRFLIDSIAGWEPDVIGRVANLNFANVVVDEDEVYVNGYFECKGAYIISRNMIDVDTFVATIYLDSIHYLKAENIGDFAFMPFLVKINSDGNVAWTGQIYTESPNVYCHHYDQTTCGLTLNENTVYFSCSPDDFIDSRHDRVRFYFDRAHTIPYVCPVASNSHVLITAYEKSSGSLFDYYLVDTINKHTSESLYIQGGEIILTASFPLLCKSELCRINKVTKEVTKTSPISYSWTNIGSKNMYINSNGWVFRGETGSEPRVFDSIFVGNYQKASVMTFFYDSTLDQRIKPCPRVDSLWGDSIVRHTAVLYWHGRYGQVGYEVAYISEGGNWDNATTLETSDTSASITLPDDQCYQFRIRGLCGGRREAYGPWSDPVTLCPTTVGIEYVESPSMISLSPNPAKDQVTVTLLPPITPSTYTLTLADACGREMLRFPHLATRLQIDLTTLPAGLYLVTLTTPQGSFTQKLVVE